MILRFGQCALLCFALAAGAGCDNRAQQCDKLAQAVRGAVKKEMPASADIMDKKGDGQEAEIARVMRRASTVVSIEVGAFTQNRTDKSSASPKGAAPIQSFAKALAGIETDNEELKKLLKSYADSVESTWKLSTEPVDGGTKAKLDNAGEALKVEQEKLVTFCAAK